MSIIIDSLENIEEVNMAFSVKFTLTSKWFDRRLTFNNLHDDEFLNEIDYTLFEKLWVPIFIFENTKDKFTTRFDQKAKIFIEKRGNFSLAPETSTEEIAYYDGSENIIRYTRNFYLRFKCQFELQFYPFDRQMCTIILKKNSREERFIKLHPEKVFFKGPKDMEDFFLQSVDIIGKSDESAADAQIRIFLKRRVAQHLLYTYLPSFCILIISQVKLIYKKIKIK